jgi:hypothetical protein
MLCQCWSYFFHWFNIEKMSNILILYQCHFKTCCYNVTLTSYEWLYQHWTLNILLRCCKSTHTKRGQVCDGNSLLKFKFLILSSKFIMWVCIFNLMFLSPRVLLQIVSAPLCFTNLHFKRNYRWYLRCYVACRSLFCPWMSLFRLKNSSRCYKLLIYLLNIQIVVDGNVIFH